MTSTITESNPIVPLIEPQNHQSGGIDGDSFFAGRIIAFDIIVMFGELTGNAVLKVFSGATAGTKTTAETFRYRLSDAELKTTGGDTFGDWATASSLTLTAASYEDFTLVIKMSPAGLTDGQPWVTLEIDNAASELFVSAVAIVHPRYASHDPQTLIE